MLTPNLVIFRYDDFNLIQYQLNDKFEIIDDGGRYFTVEPDDSYILIKNNQIILASKAEGGSHDLAWYSLANDITNDPENIVNINKDKLNVIIQYLCTDFLTATNKLN